MRAARRRSGGAGNRESKGHDVLKSGHARPASCYMGMERQAGAPDFIKAIGADSSDEFDMQKAATCISI